MADEFKVHLLNAKGLQSAEIAASAFETLLATLDEGCAIGGRERALVVTKLQEASFWAKRSIAINPAHQLDLSQMKEG